MTQSFDVAVVGSLNADLFVRTRTFPRPGETVTGSNVVLAPGGKSANQAVAASRLGARTAMVGAVGDDAHADMVLASLREAGVDIARVVRAKSTVTGTAMITVDAAGENTIVVSSGANALLDVSVVESHADVIESARVLCLCLEVSAAAMLRAAEIGRRAGTTVILNPSPYHEVDPELLAVADVVLCNEHEFAQLIEHDDRENEWDWTAAAAAAARRGLRAVVVTRGAAGAVVMDQSSDRSTVTVPAPSVDPVDTTGAGDAFTGALAAALARGDDLVGAVTFGVRVGAYATQAAGAQGSYPTAEQLREFGH